jgi:hypothetical protein
LTSLVFAGTIRTEASWRTVRQALSVLIVTA